MSELLYILQKQVCCFNHQMVTLIADKLERYWFQVLSHPERLVLNSCNHNTLTTLRSCEESLQMHTSKLLSLSSCK